jgi:adenylate cyclase
MNLKKYIAELKRRNVFKAGIAYVVIAWVLMQVAAIVFPTFSVESDIMKLLLLVIIIVFPVWLIFAWNYRITPAGIKKNKGIDQDSFEYSRSDDLVKNKKIVESSVIDEPVDTTKKSIAVLPFSNMSPDKEQDYFCAGIAEDILCDLTNLEGIYALARSSSFAYKGKNQDIREIGKILGVNTIVEGSVRKAGNKLRITAQLINVADGFRLWSERYDRELEDVFAIQNEIAKNIVQALELKLTIKEKNELEKMKTKDVQAYDYYIRGRDYFHQAHKDKILPSIQLFKKAIQKDENYALAFTGLADSYSLNYMYYDKSEENLKLALDASQRALDLDPELAEAHSSRGYALAQNDQFEEAVKEFEKAIQLNPKYFDAYYDYARICRNKGKHELAVDLFEKALQVEPENYHAAHFLVDAYADLNMDKEMLAANERALKIFRRHIDLNPDDARALYLGAGSLIRADKQKEALQWAKKAVSIKPDEAAVLYNATCIYSLLGKVDEAIDFFEKAIEAGFASLEWVNNDSDLDSIRDHPRFQNILEKLN